MEKKVKPLIGQIKKFYLTNFLKHQTYFFPIIVLFYQANHLSYWEIFLLYSIKSVVFVLLEIPSGIIADFIGKNKANIFARFMVIPALLLFIVADSFWMFFLANLLMNIGDVFKSGTHKAIMFDYLKDHSEIKKSYSQLIGETKVFSRMGEGVASLVGAAIAGLFGFRIVFVLSLFPAVLNFFNALSYEKIKEPYTDKRKAFKVEEYKRHFRESILFLKDHPVLIVLMINSSLIFFSWSVSTIILQPFLVKIGISISNFGLIYLMLLSAAAMASKYSSLMGNMIGKRRAINYFGWAMIIPFFFLSQSVNVVVLLISFILINFIKSAYHPLMISEIAGKANANIRATVLSIAAIFGSVLYLVTLPLTGYIIDISNISTVMIIAAIVLVFNQAFFNLWCWKFNR
jgi:MFS family permease